MARHTKWRYDKHCCYCKRTLEPPGSGSAGYTHDHVKPRSNGGRRTVPCCRACNDLKDYMDPAAWRRFMASNPEWWKLWKVRRVRV